MKTQIFARIDTRALCLRMRAVFSVVAVFGVVAACTETKISAPAGMDERAQRIIGYVLAGQRDSILAHTPEAGHAQALEGLRQLDSILAARPIDSLRLVGTRNFFIKDVTNRELTYFGRSPAGVVQISVTTSDKAGSWTLMGMRANVVPNAALHNNDFTFSGRPFASIVFFVLAIGVTIFTFGTAIFVGTRSKFKRRWLWAFVALIGCPTLIINWATGAISMNALNVLMFGMAFGQSNPYEPLFISVAIPAGALLALSRYRAAMRRVSETVVLPDQLSPPVS